jgi:ElaA protein
MRPELRISTFRELDASTLYAILRLRGDVFVVEQKCFYADLDGRDTEPGTRHLWFVDGDRIVAYLRILDDGEHARIGRVLTAADARGAGLAGQLMSEALQVIGDRSSVLDAQAHLVSFYHRFGYDEAGPEFIEDGIPHVPMLRAARPPAP